MKFFKDKKGFTLVELVVVIAILGILGGIAIPRFMDATASARGAKIVADMRTVDSAIMMYNAKTGVLPGDSADLLSDVAASGEAKAKVKLLAAWPVPPSGTAKITNNAGVVVTITTADTYILDATNGRALLGTKNVDALLATES